MTLTLAMLALCGVLLAHLNVLIEYLTERTT